MTSSVSLWRTASNRGLVHLVSKLAEKTAELSDNKSLNKAVLPRFDGNALQAGRLCNISIRSIVKGIWWHVMWQVEWVPRGPIIAFSHS